MELLYHCVYNPRRPAFFHQVELVAKKYRLYVRSRTLTMFLFLFEGDSFQNNYFLSKMCDNQFFQFYTKPKHYRSFTTTMHTSNHSKDKDHFTRTWRIRPFFVCLSSFPSFIQVTRNIQDYNPLTGGKERSIFNSSCGLNFTDVNHKRNHAHNVQWAFSIMAFLVTTINQSTSLPLSLTNS